MALTLKEIFEKRQKVGTELLSLRDKHKATQGDWPAEDSAAFERMSAEYDGFKSQEDTLEAERTKAASIAARDARFAQLETDQQRTAPGTEPGRDDYSGRHDGDADQRSQPQRRDYAMALQAWARMGTEDGPTEQQLAAAQRCGFNPKRRTIRLGLLSSEHVMSREPNWTSGGRLHRQAIDSRALTVGVNADGGYLIPTDFAMSLEEQLLTIGGPRAVSSVIRTASGNPFKWPGVDDTSNEGEQLDELAAIGAEAKPTFNQKTWNAYRFSSKPIKVSYELLEDSPFNLAALIGKLCGERLARITTRRQTTGTGTSQAQGVTIGISAGVTCASATAFTGDELIAMTHSIDPAYRSGPKVGWMMHDNLLLKVRIMKDGQGNYLWDKSSLPGVPDRLATYPVTTNSYMASAMTAAAKAMIFGDFEKYCIRDVNSIRLKRLDELYAETDEIGFIAFMRTDSKWLNTSCAKTLVMAPA